MRNLALAIILVLSACSNSSDYYILTVDGTEIHTGDNVDSLLVTGWNRIREKAYYNCVSSFEITNSYGLYVTSGERVLK